MVEETKPPTQFRKSRFSGLQGCVEVARIDEGERVLVRDSKNRNGSYLCFTREEWKAFVLGVGSGEFDI